MGDRRKPDIPERIYLQVWGEDDPAEDKKWPVDWNWGDITWCRDRIWESDIEYVRVKKGRKRGR